MGKYVKFREDEDIREDAPIWAHRINDLLREKNITQAELAKEIGVSASTLSGWIKGDKSGRFTEPKIESFKKIADKYDVSMDFLVGISDSMKKEDHYKTGAKYFGLHDKSMDRLSGLLNQYSMKCSDGNQINKKAQEISSSLINFILEDENFWFDFERLVLDYVKVIYEKQDNKIPQYETTMTEIIQYRMNKVFDELVEDMFLLWFPKNKPSKLFEALTKSKKKTQGEDKQS